MGSSTGVSRAGILNLIAQHEKQSKIARDKHLSAQKKCPGCLALLSFESRRDTYCSRTCWAKHKQPPPKKIRPPCPICNTSLKTNARKYCSQRCHLDDRYRQFIELWLSGEASGGDWWGVKPAVRRWIIENGGEACSVCHWNTKNQTSGRIPLQIDHIDGNPNNHSRDNLRLLCPNCHSLTPTWGGLNRGRGRKERYRKLP